MHITCHKDGQTATPEPPKTTSKATLDLRLASVAELLGTASRVVEDATAESNIFDPEIEKRIPKFSDKEISAGSIIGRGGFGVVRDVEKIRTGGLKRRDSFRSIRSGASATKDISSGGRGGFLMLCFRSGGSEENTSTNKSVISMDASRHSDAVGKPSSSTEYRFDRDHIASRSKKTRKNGGRYVIKSISKDLDKITYMKGNVDIAMEVKFLSVLDHHNIIELVGVSRAKPCTPGYFIILDKMSDTLAGKIKKWMDKDRLYKGVTGFFSGGKKKEQELYRERIAASYDIATGLFYLHSKKIIYRDLKPANIGFDSLGQLKIFDFGLAKELKDTELRRDGTYRNMTATTGAVRYMAPEVGLGRPYNLSADVYSWSMVMWFILALEPPFGFYTENMIVNRVHRKGSRPAIFRRWNHVIGEMMKSAWDPDMSARPDFLEITLVLKQELNDCESGATDGTVVGSAMGSQFEYSEREQDEAQPRPTR